jgi:ABC-type Zn uptake system ZnuABC Zn-binding protein ZnuA
MAAVTQETINYVKRLHAKDFSIAAISELAKVSPTTIRRIFDSDGSLSDYKVITAAQSIKSRVAVDISSDAKIIEQRLDAIESNLTMALSYTTCMLQALCAHLGVKPE